MGVRVDEHFSTPFSFYHGLQAAMASWGGNPVKSRYHRRCAWLSENILSQFSDDPKHHRFVTGSTTTYTGKDAEKHRAQRQSDRDTGSVMTSLLTFGALAGGAYLAKRWWTGSTDFSSAASADTAYSMGSGAVGTARNWAGTVLCRMGAAVSGTGGACGSPG